MSGPQCCSNPPTLNPSAGAGHVEKFAGLDSYLTGSPHSKLAILLVSDIYGYEAPNLRNLADKVAAAGYYVVVPDFFYGDPYNPENANRPLPVWLKDHGTDKGFEVAKPIVEALKSKGVSAIGAAGFCWGAKVVVELAKSRLIQAAVQLHPSFVSLDDINGEMRGKRKMTEASNEDKKDDSRAYFTWNLEMDRALADILRDQRSMGNKSDGAWKGVAYNTAAQMLSSRFNLQLIGENVKNRIKLWRSWYGIVSDILSQSGFDWDGTKYMISVTNEDAWNEYVKVKSNLKPLGLF